MKNSLEHFNIFEQEEERNGKLEDRKWKYPIWGTKRKNNEENSTKSKRCVGHYHTNICTVGVPEGRNREKSAQRIFKEIMAPYSPK